MRQKLVQLVSIHSSAIGQSTDIGFCLFLTAGQNASTSLALDHLGLAKSLIVDPMEPARR